MSDKCLFAGKSLGDILRAQHEWLRDFVLGLDANAVLAAAFEDLLDRVVAQ